VLLGIPPAVLIMIALRMARAEHIAGIPALWLSSAIALLGPIVYAIHAALSRTRMREFVALGDSRETGD
jgi:hypothetical protein